MIKRHDTYFFLASRITKKNRHQKIIFLSFPLLIWIFFSRRWCNLLFHLLFYKCMNMKSCSNLFHLWDMNIMKEIKLNKSLIFIIQKFNTYLQFYYTFFVFIFHYLLKHELKNLINYRALILKFVLSLWYPLNLAFSKNLMYTQNLIYTQSLFDKRCEERTSLWYLKIIFWANYYITIFITFYLISS